MKKAEEYLIHIVEDDEPSRILLSKSLTGLNFKTLEAENGLIALEQLEKNTPDLFLVDVMLPNLDGFELITKIREMDRFKETPIIMTTALDDAKHIKKSIAVGANGYVVKPIHMPRLKSKIFKQLNIED